MRSGRCSPGTVVSGTYASGSSRGRCAIEHSALAPRRQTAGRDRARHAGSRVGSPRPGSAVRALGSLPVKVLPPRRSLYRRGQRVQFWDARTVRNGPERRFDLSRSTGIKLLVQSRRQAAVCSRASTSVVLDVRTCRRALRVDEALVGSSVRQRRLARRRLLSPWGSMTPRSVDLGTKDREPLATYDGNFQRMALAFSPDGRRLA